MSRALPLWAMGLACSQAFAQTAAAPAAETAATAAPQTEIVERIQREVAAIRGLSFKEPVKLATRTAQEFQQRLDARVTMMSPPAIDHYEQIMRKLGLYRGPQIADVAAMLKMTLRTQVAAYYLPAENTFFMRLEPQSDVLRWALYAHELHHGLQHQNFDLLTYMQPPGGASQDALLARRAVVEGEASYIMTLWLAQHLRGRLPSRDMLAPIIAMQSQATRESLRKLLADSNVSKLAEGMQPAIAALDQIPNYIVQTLYGAYLKGQAFVFEVQADGWSAVDAAFSTHPPLSTEQILHPEKWTAHEGCMQFSWPAFAAERRLRGWQLLEEDVLGEFRWRIVFGEHGFKAEAESAAAGWNGDRYAVFKRKDSNALLLLLRTSWDTVADATEFADLYRRVLVVKYQGAAEAVRVVQRGTEVAVVEGGRPADLDGLLEWVSAVPGQRLGD